MNRVLLSFTLALALLPLSGCFGGGDDGFDFVPGTKFKETGKTVHLKATVIDYDSEVVPGIHTWLWAFCFEPVNPEDAYSANAIEGFTPVDGDKAASAVGPNAKCSVPGPTLRVKQGDRVKVEFSHSHFHPHTIHWHGQFVPWESDGAPGVSQDGVPSGGSFTYDFIAKRAGTLWYHCHVDTQLHLMQGLYGMMIVEPQDQTYEPKDIDQEYEFIFSTMERRTVEAIGTTRHSHPPGCASGFPDFNGAACENPPSQAGEPDIFLLNGHSYPKTMDQPETLIVAKEGDRIRIRFLNAGETVEQIHPHGHDMLVIGKDGNPLAPSARFWADTLTIGPAERYDVVMVMDNPGPWMMHTHVSSHETNCGKSPGGMHTMLVYDTYVDKMHQFRAEAPASCPFGGELELPGDFVNHTSFASGSAVATPVPVPGAPVGQAFTAQWSWPIDLPCAVRKMAFYARALGPTALQSQTDVRLAVFQPGATTEVTALTLDQDTPTGSYIIEGKTLPTLTATPGNYTVTLSGYGVDTTVELDVWVDYYETFEQSKVGHLTYKSSGCLGYT